MSEVRITVDDREDQTHLRLPDNFFGEVSLLFRAGVLVSTRKTESLAKKALKETPTATDEHGLTPTG